MSDTLTLTRKEFEGVLDNLLLVYKHEPDQFRINLTGDRTNVWFVGYKPDNPEDKYCSNRSYAAVISCKNDPYYEVYLNGKEFRFYKHDHPLFFPKFLDGSRTKLKKLATLKRKELDAEETAQKAKAVHEAFEHLADTVLLEDQ